MLMSPIAETTMAIEYWTSAHLKGKHAKQGNARFAKSNCRGFVHALDHGLRTVDIAERIHVSTPTENNLSQ